MENFFQQSVEERRRELLRALGRERLQALCTRHSLTVSDGRKLDSYVDAILQAGIPMFETLCIFSRDELKSICRAIGLNEVGTEKVVLAKRISRSISTRGITHNNEDSEEEIEDKEPKEAKSASRLPSPESIIGDFFRTPSPISMNNIRHHEETVLTTPNLQNAQSALPSKQEKLVPTFRSLRKLLDVAYPTDADLDAFIIDNFREIKRRISAGMERKAKINLLFECVDPSNLLGNLLTEHPDIEKKSGIIIEYEE